MLLHPYQRAGITSLASCESGYEWMDNQETSPPCLLVAYVIAACTGNSWTQPALPSGSHYDGPSGTTVTPCYCSWSCYNLMMACTFCQGPNDTDSLQTWSTFVQNCTSSETDAYFPSNYSIAGNETIPYWAAVNPTNWEGQIWNEQEAYQYYLENKTDLNPNVSTASTGSQSSNLGAIVGGTVGGAVFLLLLGFGTYILCRRQRYRRVRTPPAAEVNGGQNPNWQMYNRQLSDLSTATGTQPRTVSPMTYYTGTGSQTVPSLRSSLPLTSFTLGADTTSYNTSSAQLRPSAPMV
ncbi:hypothetical protein M404DRAFT_1003265 [Pisolithus tinctorius Marx 270]|uniref:Uncharacterized protein n=1 Tax=Pisolithus tinctorius Marx 270 TaxID=870435 RepID=A0A0C3P171_PISTI|nr:hypothetical protein M404DRAFT_1003265 [Pisolithus tinctorius Marx 270]